MSAGGTSAVGASPAHGFSEPGIDDELGMDDYPNSEDGLDPDQSGSLSQVMATENAQSSKPRAETRVPLAEKRKAPPPKRKMLMDDEIQLTTEQIRAQLQDPSAIVRDLDAEASRADGQQRGASTTAARAHGMSHDPLIGPPLVHYLPSGVADFLCFKPKLQEQLMPATKRPCLDENSRASSVQPDFAGTTIHSAADLATHGESPDVMRSASRSSAADVDHAVLSAAEPDAPPDDSFGEPGEFHVPMEDEVSMPQDDEPVDGELTVDDGEPQPAGFDPAQELPDVEAAEAHDGEQVGETQSQSLANHDPAAWNPRTRKMYKMLSTAFDESTDEPLSYNAMIATTRTSEKRKVVAGCFQELLFLTTHGLIELDQRKPYGNILIAKTELFAGAAA